MMLIEQAEEIAEKGCEHIKSCHSQCLLSKHGCGTGNLMDYKDGKFIARSFLAGVKWSEESAKRAAEYSNTQKTNLSIQCKKD